MNKHVHETSRQTAKMNRERLAVERAAVMDEEEKRRFQSART